MLSYSLPDSRLPVPVNKKIDGGFLIFINHQLTRDIGQDVILCSQPIDMDLHLKKNVKSPINNFDAVSKA